MQETQENIVYQIQRLAEDIDKLNLSTETQFLKIGAEIFSLHSSSKKIAKNAEEVSSIFSNGNLDITINQIESASQALTEFIKASLELFNHVHHELAKVYKLLNVNTENLNVFKNINKKLGILAVSIKIESARAGQAGLGFLTLAENINSLSTVIIGKVESINNKNEEVSSAITHLREKVQLISKSLIKNQNEIGSEAEVQMAAFKSYIIGNKQLFQSIDKRIFSMSKGINQLVTLCQYHDIVRQQLEHVVEDLKGIAEYKFEDTENYRQYFSFCYKGVELEERQFNNSADTFLKTVYDIQKEIKLINNEGYLLKNDLATILDKNEKNEDSALDKFINIMKPIVDSLSKDVDESTNIIEVISSVNDVIMSINMFIKDIEKIKIEIDLLSINSFIKANLLGNDGATLGVLSEEIQNIAFVAQTETIKMSKNFEQIISITNTLFLDENGSNRQDELKNVHLHLKNIVESFDTLQISNNSINDKIASIDNDFENLTNNISHLLDSITVHEDFKSGKDKVNQDIMEVNACIAETGISPNEFDFSNHPIFVSALKKYTMEDERQIFQNSLNNNNNTVVRSQEVEKSGSFDAFEMDFFEDFANLATETSNTEESTKSSNLESNSEFDDNIELF